jgi:hypothetical protein
VGSARKSREHFPSFVQIPGLSKYCRSEHYEGISAENDGIRFTPSYRKRLPASVQQSQLAGSEEVDRQFRNLSHLNHKIILRFPQKLIPLG